MKKIVIVGDVHCDWNRLNEIIEKEKPDILISTGDFGYWPDHYPLNDDTLNTQNTKIYFCPGNHEHWDLLDSLENNEIVKNVYYMKFGSVLQLSNGMNMLFVGGADSIDKNQRIIGVSWFQQEIIRETDLANLPNENIDIVVSHTCPEELLPCLREHDLEKVNDPSCKALSIILQIYQPKLWFFSHWHTYASGMIDDTDWECLDRIDTYKNNTKYYTVVEYLDD